MEKLTEKEILLIAGADGCSTNPYDVCNDGGGSGYLGSGDTTARDNCQDAYNAWYESALQWAQETGNNPFDYPNMPVC